MGNSVDPGPLIRKYSQACVERNGRRAIVISLQRIRSIAAQTGLLPLDVEISCLEKSVIPMRYLRNMGTIGIDGQLKLLRSRVVVCGAGGLGATMLELLARQGIGHLVIIDNGRFEENNLNRQITCSEADLRKSKVKVAAQRVKSINSAVAVTPVNRFMDCDNIEGFITGADVVLDGLDSLATRLSVAGACDKMKIPFVHGAVAGFSGQIMTILPGDKGLAAVYGAASEKCTYGVEAITGNPPATPAIIAAWEVQEAVKIITGTGTPIRNRLIFLDFAECIMEEIPLV